MSGKAKRRMTLVGSAAVLTALWAAIASPAAAAPEGDKSGPTAIVLSAPSETSWAFGARWSLEARVVSSPGKFNAPVDAGEGTVDVFVEGIAGPFIDDAPIQAGGVAYLTQPDGVPPLGAGDHRLSAVFTPAAGSGLDISQTSAPVTLTITPLALEPSIGLVDGSLGEKTASLRLSLGGAYVEAAGAAPAGIWHVQVATATGKTAFTKDVTQTPSVTPIEIVVPALDDDSDYSATATFEPAAEVAPGVTVTAPAPVAFTTLAPGNLDWLTETVPLPTAAAIAVLVVTALLVLAAIIITILRLVRRTRASRRVPEDEVEPETKDDPILV
jgi:hypothetical protein